MEELINIIKSTKHPARVLDFDILVTGLNNEVKEGTVNVNYHPDYPHLAIYKYTQKAVTDKRWNVFSLISRGLILDLLNRHVVATPFVKFFNYGELIDPQLLITNDYVVTEKSDGSLGIAFFYDKKWIVSTCGSFTSEQGSWATKWICESIDARKLSTTNTYLFEIIYPENRIVVSYDFEGLTLLAIYDENGEELSYSQLRTVSETIGTKLAAIYQFDDMSAIVNAAKSLDRQHEGYVVRFSNGSRLKVKGDEYIRIHRVVSRITPLGIWELLAESDNLDETAQSLPEEVQKDFWVIVKILREKLETFVDDVEAIYTKTKDLTDKEFGLLLNHKEAYRAGYSPNAREYVFSRRKGKFDLTNGSFRQKIFKQIKPTGNKLDGYKPCSILNRFNQDG